MRKKSTVMEKAKLGGSKKTMPLLNDEPLKIESFEIEYMILINEKNRKDNIKALINFILLPSGIKLRGYKLIEENGKLFLSPPIKLKRNEKTGELKKYTPLIIVPKKLWYSMQNEAIKTKEEMEIEGKAKLEREFVEYGR